MKILISADMEGATGVTWPADVLPGTPQWERCRAMFTSDGVTPPGGVFGGGGVCGGVTRGPPDPAARGRGGGGRGGGRGGTYGESTDGLHGLHLRTA
ncbi:M55 family metallopeptidase, partial [Streptomyces sp. NPDC059037]|uniref:M55 family metallopeptidase n=1 Tax=Streptomyces sp. NPDC059037 TaxID=3346710 RepID=UPI0036CBFDF2